MNKGLQIKERRMELGISQAALARKLSKTRSLLSYIEKTGKVNDLTYYEIMIALGITPEMKSFGLANSRLSMLSEAKVDYIPKISELDHLRKENESLKDIIELQKSIIAMLQKQTSK
jgi:transcriptional regulator with XRE-family HTH domain